MARSLFDRGVNYLKWRSYVFLMKHGRCVPDKLYLQIVYWLQMGKRLNLKTPRTFTEKLQWLKLYNRRPEYTTMVDKYAVKEYVAGKIGKEYVIPTLGVWNHYDEIDFDTLPNQFVLKTTQAGGGMGVVVCRDKSKLNHKKAKKKLEHALKFDNYAVQREWPYKDVKPRILAEQFIEPRPNVQDLPDFKWYCFDGEPRYCQVIQDRTTDETIDFFDIEWNHQEFVGLNPTAGPTVGPAAVTPSRPKHLEEQIMIARKLSQGMPFSRIDLYEIGDKEYFGEITFYPAAGFGRFTPERYNEVLGSMINLPGEKRGGNYSCDKKW